MSVCLNCSMNADGGTSESFLSIFCLFCVKEFLVIYFLHASLTFFLIFPTNQPTNQFQGPESFFTNWQFSATSRNSPALNGTSVHFCLREMYVFLMYGCETWSLSDWGKKVDWGSKCGSKLWPVQVAGTFDCGNEPSGSIKRGEFLD
jgi:hypothetical protein